jgi:hypothetical protein
MDWARILAFVTGTVDQELLARIEYLAAENRVVKAQLKGRLQLSDAERATLGEIGHRLGRNVLAEVATVARPDTILAWYRKLVARKFDGSKARRSPGRPRVKRTVEQLIVRMAKENRDWVMTGSWGRWPIWGTTSAIRRSVMSSSATVCRPHPGRAVDEANGPERDHGRMRRAARLPLSASRSRQQVHPVVPGDHCIRPSRTTRVAGVQSEPECLRSAGSSR